VVYPIVYRVSTIQGDAGFLPSTVVYIKKMSVGCWPTVGSVDSKFLGWCGVFGFYWNSEKSLLAAF
jgi:hypothetical protein